ncbi:MAG: IPT/TIG domain-containing protein [Pseudomonadota bacterium]
MSPLLLLLTGCYLDTDDLLDPPEPTFLQVEVTCDAGSLSVEAMIESDYEVTQVVIERVDEAGEALDPLFPTLDVSAMGGGFTRWSFEIEHDCAEPLLNTWTATTVLGASASTEVAWPDVDLQDGAVDPPYGSDAGGSSVTIRGQSMDAVTAVWFGDAAATLGAATAEQLTVSTPAGAPGTVDITLEAPFTEQVLEDAFTYWPDAAGMVTGFSQMHMHVYSPSYFSIGSAYTALSAYGPFVQLEVIMQEPLAPEVTYPARYAEAGSCAGATDIEWAALDVGAYVTFGSDDMGSLAMLSTGAEQPVYYYVEAEVDPWAWGGQVFSLELPAATAQFPAMTVADALLIPTMPSDASFDHTVANTFTWGEDLAFTWTDTTAQRLAWTLYPSAGWTVLGTVSCVADATTGELVVPWDTLTEGIDASRVTTVFALLTFIEDEPVVLPHDASTFWSMGFVDLWLYGEVVQP